MANNFLRYKLLMLSRASFEVLYTAVKPINSFIDMYVSAHISPANNVEFKSDNALNVSTTASIADTLHTEIAVSGELDFKSGIEVADADNIAIETHDRLDFTGAPNIRSAVDTEPVIASKFNVNCEVKLLRHIFYPIVNISQPLKVNCSADIATFIKTTIVVSDTVKVSPKMSIADTLHTEIAVSGELDIKCESSVATPIDTELSSASALNLTAQFKISEPNNTGMRDRMAVAVKGTGALFRKTRLSDLKNLSLSAVGGKMLNYSAADGIYLTEII